MQEKCTVRLWDRCDDNVWESASSALFDVLNLAAEAGLEIRGVLLSDQPSLDVGTTEAFNRAVALARDAAPAISSG